MKHISSFVTLCFVRGSSAGSQLLGFENTADTPAGFLRFDFKMKPLSRNMLEKIRKHEHRESR